MKRGVAIRIAVAVVVCVFAAGSWISGHEVEAWWLQYASASVFLITIIWAAYDLWIWRWRVVQRIPMVPRDIRGTWRGTLYSFWKDPVSGKKVAPKTVYLVVHQRAFRVATTLITDESKSKSSLAGLSKIDEDVVLHYLYLNKPRAKFEQRSRIHHGSTVLEVAGLPAERLNGRYWTDRDSRGELEFAQRSRRLADDFKDAEMIFRNEETGHQ